MNGRTVGCLSYLLKFCTCTCFVKNLMFDQKCVDKINSYRTRKHVKVQRISVKRNTTNKLYI